MSLDEQSNQQARQVPKNEGLDAAPPDHDPSADPQDLAQALYRAGRDAFDRGMYRQAVESLEAALELVRRGSLLGGEVQMWLVYAYEAAGKTQEAIALCEVASRHPHMDTRKEAKRVLFILKAPRLKPKAEWLTQIPDLAELEEGDRPRRFAAAAKSPPPPAPPVLYRLPEDPIDPSQVNTQDNGFVWLALGAIALFIGTLLWLG